MRALAARVGPWARRAAPSSARRPSRFVRWFTAVAAVSTVVSGVLLASVLSYFLGERMIRQEAELTRDFIQHEIGLLGGEGYFAADGGPAAAIGLQAMLETILTMPDVVRAKIYGPDGGVLGSSAPSGDHEHGPNPELERALAGEVVVESGRVSAAERRKSEHAGLDPPGGHYLESYVPVRDRAGRVIGVVELYKIPRTLFAAIRDGTLLIWLSAGAGSALLFATLIGLVRGAQRTIEAQHARLVESEAWAVTGEMSVAVAHGVRNPLAAIRSSAELLQGAHGAEVDERAADIVEATDRLDAWVRQLLDATRPPDGSGGATALAPLLRERLQGRAADLERRRIELAVELDPSLPPVRGGASLLATMLDNLIANAIDAMPDGGRLAVDARRTGADGVAVLLADTGCGMSEEALAQALRPFATTKPRGLGLGLPLARRLVERIGGRLSIDSAPLSGTRVTLWLPAAA